MNSFNKFDAIYVISQICLLEMYKFVTIPFKKVECNCGNIAEYRCASVTHHLSSSSNSKYVYNITNLNNLEGIYRFISCKNCLDRRDRDYFEYIENGWFVWSLYEYKFTYNDPLFYR